jgi:hypothetical protein
MNLPSTSQTPLQNVADIAEIAVIARTVNEAAKVPAPEGHLIPMPRIDSSPSGLANGIGIWLILGVVWHVIVFPVLCVGLAIAAAPVAIGAALTYGHPAFAPVMALTGMLSFALVYSMIRAGYRLLKRL